MNRPVPLPKSTPVRPVVASLGTLDRVAALAPATLPVGRPSPDADDVVVLVLIDLAPGSLLWGWSRVVLGNRLLREVRGLRFAKAMGSGEDGGFGLWPSATRQSLLAVFDGEHAAEDFLTASPTMAAYRAHARECCIAVMRATSSRGRWGGSSVAVTAAAEDVGAAPVAALTRASIRFSRAWKFWRHSPASEHAIAQAVGCRLAVGMGEAPLLRQATFSVWDRQTDMDAYARTGPHLDAIRAAQHEGYFSESMFVRFKVLRLEGQFKGRLHA
jgi:spheroidene monooxygenase